MAAINTPEVAITSFLLSAYVACRVAEEILMPTFLEASVLFESFASESATADEIGFGTKFDELSKVEVCSTSNREI